ncbi:MAG: hypothetical protein H6727_11115 [Myxococcales bacterium]|nr:hypothetical protein [Myxococcales bacterium]
MSRLKACGLVCALIFFTALGLQLLLERCFWRPAPSPSRKLRAALAIRDHVIPFQKWGTRQFTWPYLKKYYDQAWYFTHTRNNKDKAAFIARLEEALDRYEAVDLFFLAHGNHYYQWLSHIPRQKRKRLRLVYNTGCKDLWQGRYWLALGAKAYIGHPGVSASPLFYVYFLRRWTLGQRLNELLGPSNAAMRRVLHLASPVLPAPLTPEKVYLDSKAFCYGTCSFDIHRTAF